MRTVSAIGEFGLIGRIAKKLPQAASVLAGIGDDAAVLRLPSGRQLLFASDMLVEGTHFLRSRLPARAIGWKALAVNISDIAAMGGLPHWAVVSLGLPPETPVAFVDGLYAGLAACGKRYGVSIVGGDTVRAPQVVIDVAIVGSVEPGLAVLRSGARTGDALFVTGRLGGSYAGGRHARFAPRLREAQMLLRRLRIHAMMDLSDGLASDLWRMSEASRVVLRVEAVRIPKSPGCTLKQALMNGEDFELLFAASPRDAARMPSRLGRCSVTRIGTVVRRGVGVEMVSANDAVKRLKPEGFAHF